MVGLTVQPVPNADAFNRMAWEILINPIVVQGVAAHMSYVKVAGVLTAVQKAWTVVRRVTIVPVPLPVKPANARTHRRAGAGVKSVLTAYRSVLPDAMQPVTNAIRWQGLQASPMFSESQQTAIFSRL